MDLTKLDVPALLTLQKQVAAEIPKRRDAAVVELRRKIYEQIEAAGFTSEEVLGSVATFGKRKPGKKVEAKYKSADGEAWSGRGRKPIWVVNHLDNGGKLEELAI